MTGDQQKAVALAEEGIRVAPTPTDPSTAICWEVLCSAALGRQAADPDSFRGAEAVMARVTSPFEHSRLVRALLEGNFFMDHSRAGALLSELTALADRVGAPSLLAEAAFFRGRYLMWIKEPSDPDGALRSYEQGLDLARTAGDRWLEIWLLVGVAITSSALGSQRARTAWHEALSCLCASREWWGLSLPLSGVTSWFAANGNPTAAAVTAGYLELSRESWKEVDERLQALGFDRDPAAASAMTRGAGMDVDAIIAYVLRELEET